MRQRGDAGAARPAAGERPVVRANQIFVRPVDPAHERGGDALLTGAHENRLGADRAAAAAVRAARGARLGLEQRDPLAVDRDVDVLEPRVRTRHQIDLEHVLAVGRKDVLDDHAAARPERRAFDVVPGVLRDVARARVDRVDRRRVTVADRHPADRRAGVEVRLEQRRRQRLRVGDVVEVRALGVERQPAAGVDVERQQIADGARVLGPIQPLERADAGIRIGGRGGIQRGFERV